MLKQNNFNNPLKKLTIYVGKKNKINELEEIILFEDTPEIKKTIIAKSGVAVNDNNKNLLVLVDGSIQEERKDRKISILDFDKTTLDLSQYNKKTIDYYCRNPKHKHLSFQSIGQFPQVLYTSIYSLSLTISSNFSIFKASPFILF